MGSKHCTELQQFHSNNIPKGPANEKSVHKIVIALSFQNGTTAKSDGLQQNFRFGKTIVKHSSRIEIKVM
jgi:hypothetical protein